MLRVNIFRASLAGHSGTKLPPLRANIHLAVDGAISVLTHCGFIASVIQWTSWGSRLLKKIKKIG